MMKLLTLQNIRRAYSVFFVLLFVYLLMITDFRNMKGYEVSLFLEINPLVALSSFLSGWTLYKGLALSLIVIVTTSLFGRYFCSWVCPMGIINQWTSHFLNRHRPVDDYKLNAYRPVFRFKYYLLTIFLVLAAFGSLQVGLADPIALITRS
ncbi:MAG: 4Fe-4S binding protein, partial [Nitrospiraceae bacterium]